MKALSAVEEAAFGAPAPASMSPAPARVLVFRTVGDDTGGSIRLPSQAGASGSGTSRDPKFSRKDTCATCRRFDLKHYGASHGTDVQFS